MTKRNVEEAAMVMQLKNRIYQKKYTIVSSPPKQ